MIDFSNAELDRLITHYIGNTSHEESNLLSSELSVFGERERDFLFDYFLQPLAEKEDLEQLSHADQLTDNLVYRECARVFQDESTFVDMSQVLADYLGQVSNHPRIQSGYLNVALFSNVLVDDELVTAIGLFKSETTTQFFKFNARRDNYEIAMDEGFSFNELDKAFLCINSFHDDGFVCLSHDVKRNTEQAKFWRENFLGLKPMSTAYYQTAELMKLTKSFVTEELPENFSVPRPDQIDMLNRSADFFKNQNEFDRNEFVNNVFDNHDMQESFQTYQQEYQNAHELEIPERFELSPKAVQQKSKVFKSILKLDKNFHVYIHGDRSKIEFGREVDGRKFYKIYFDEEK